MRSALWLAAAAVLAGCLQPTLDPASDAAGLPEGAIAFLEPMLLGGAYLGGDEATCAVSNCGGSEPSIEIAADGTIYVTGVCCIGASPPIWVSRDAGATFSLLTGDALRDSFGIEGDFAIDDAGNMYFADISAASTYFASWDKDGGHRWTIPASTMVPIVDRPWVRAGAEDVVYFFYNQGATSMFYHSSDGALTWTYGGVFPAGQQNLGQGPERDHLWITAEGKLFESADGGVTWSAGEAIPRPSEGGASFHHFDTPVVDEGGNLWVVYDWRLKQPESNTTSPTYGTPANPARDDVPFAVYASRRSPEGEWAEPFLVSPAGGTHVFPWAAAGRDGALAIAWYGAPNATEGADGVGQNEPWYLHVAYTTDGGADAPTFTSAIADRVPVLHGPLERNLLDFLQIEIAPDGSIHVGYARNENESDDELTWYVRTDGALGLAPLAYPNGPKAATEPAASPAVPALRLPSLR